MGIKPTLKPHATLTAIAESPLRQGLILAGTDDGKVHMTLDGGVRWEDLTDRFDLPGERFVTRVLPSAHDAGTAYVAFGRYLEANDFRPYLFRTRDSGDSWESLAAGMPEHAVVKGLAEHPRRPELLFAGVHNGLLVSIDGGEHWAAMLGEHLPAVAVHDIEIEPRHHDLVLGTYGRGIVVLDDIGFLEGLDASVLDGPVHLFPVDDVARRPRRQRLMFTDGAMSIVPNPPGGAAITYYLRDDPQPPETPQPARGRGRRGGQGTGSAPEPTVLITILDSEARVVAELEAPEGRGLHRVHWDPFRVTRGGRGRGRGRRGGAGEPEPGPREFTVRLVARGQVEEQVVVVLPDADH